MSLRSNVLASFGGQFFASALALLLAPAYIGRLGLEAWGLVGILALLGAWFNLLDVGLTPTITRELAAVRGGEPAARLAAAGLVRCVEWIYVGLAIAIVGVVALSSGFLVSGWLRLETLPVGEARTAIVLIGVVVALRLYENIYRSVLTGLEELVALHALSSVFALLRWGGGLAFVFWRDAPTVVDLFGWHAAVAALSVLVFALWGRRRLHAAAGSARADLQALRRIRAFAGGIAASSVLGLLLSQIDKILLSKFLPLADFGLYTLAASLADALALLAAPLYGALAPRFVRLHQASDVPALGALYLQASQVLAVVLVPCAFLLVVHGDAVVRAWSGDAALAAQIAPLVALLALGRMLNATMQLPAALQFGAGWTSLGAKMNLGAVLLLVPLVLLAVPVYGALAYAWCWLALNLGTLCVGTWAMHRRLLPELRNRWLRDAVLVPVALALAWMAGVRGLADLPDGRVALGGVLALVLLGGIAIAAMAHPSKVTLAIPTYRRPQLLRRALECAARQNYRPLEVIVADNATEGDEVATVIASFRDRIEDLRYVRHERNIGAVNNFAFCLEQATGDYFMWLADDDELADASVPALAAPLDEDPSVVTVVPHWRLKRSPESGWRVGQRVYASRSALRRVLRYVWRSNDAFYYGLHRRKALLECRFPRFAWPNAGTVADTAYPYLMTLVLAGRIVAVREPQVEWINHAYSEKSYADPQPFLVYAPRHVLRRINLHAIYFGQVGRALGWVAAIAVVPVSVASLVTELAAGFVRKLRRAFGAQVEAVAPADKG